MELPQQNVFQYFVGDTKVMSLRGLYLDNLEPLDLTDCTEIAVKLPNSDGSFTQLKLSLAQVSITSPAVLGGFQATLTASDYPLPNVGEFQSFLVTFTILSKPITIEYVNVLSIFQN